MTHISRLLTLSLFLLVLACAGLAQERQRPNRPGANLSPEEWKQQQAQVIDRKTKQFMNKMGDLVPDEKKPRLQQFVQIFLVEELKIRMEMMASRSKVQGDRQAMRELMMSSQEKVEKLKSQARDAAKKLLDDQEAFRAFRKNLETMSPKRGPGGRGGGGGQGGRGGGGGGGGGGGDR